MFMTVREVISNKLAAVSVRDLLLVEAVAMKRSFRYAAIDMGISTSGLSYQVKKVEEILGQPIFERGSKITPTAFGKEVLDLIAVILEGVTRLEGLRDDGLALPFGQTLRIGVISSLAPDNLLRIIQICAHRSGKTKVELVSGKHQGLLRRLQNREIDLLISAAQSVPEGMAYTSLFKEHFVSLVRADKLQPELHPLMLCEPGLLPLSEDDFVPSLITEGLSKLLSSGLTRTYGLGVEHRMALVAAGYGHALLPYGWVRDVHLPDHLAVMELPPALSAERELGCFWRHSYMMGSQISQAFSEAW